LERKWNITFEEKTREILYGQNSFVDQLVLIPFTFDVNNSWCQCVSPIGNILAEQTYEEKTPDFFFSRT
jgi:hypothetical protein